MFFSKMMKRPVLMIGILFGVIFLYQLRDKGFFEERREKLMPTSCRAVRVKLDRRIPTNWKTSCTGNNLEVQIDVKISNKVSTVDQVRPLLYRELANSMILIAQKSPSDNLERTNFITVKFQHRLLDINALTEGKFLVKLATLKNKGLIAKLFKQTVQVKELPK